MIAYEEQARLRVVHDVVNLLCIELMQDGYGDSTVGECSEEGHCPLAGVTPAEGYLVAFLDTAVLKQDVQFLNLTRHIVELQRLTLEVGRDPSCR